MDTKFLIELIEKNTRVILPDFGAFLVKDDGTGVFKPQNITFSPFLRFNDGVLEDALMKGKKVSKDEANKQIVKFIEDIKADLSSKGNFQLGTFGSLYRDKRGSIHFSTDEGIIDSKKESELAPPIIVDEQPEAPTLLNIADEITEGSPENEKPVEPIAPPVEELKDSKPSQIEPESKETPLTNKVEPEKKEIPKPSKATTPKKFTPVAKPKPQTEPVPEKSKTKKEAGAGKAILMGVLIGVLFIGIAAGGWYLYTEGYFSSTSDEAENEDIIKVEVKETPKEEVANDAPKSQLESEFEKSAPIEKPKQQVSTSQVKQPAPTAQPEKQTKPKPTTPPVTKPTISSSGQFHVVVGSFRNLEYAEKYSNDLKRSGFASQVIKRENGMHSVTLGSYNTRDEATQTMNQYRSQHPSAWILKQ
jgi:nucleoid DNA-binding protein